MQLKNKMEQCKFCGTQFRQEKTLGSHVCVKKRRFMDLDSTGSRIGFRSFQRFFELTSQNRKPKTTDDFINSPFYIDFVKFGNYIALLKPVYIDQFIDFNIRNSVKLKDWTKQYVYDTYIEDLIKKEPPFDAIDRSIVFITEWCNENSVQFNEFFIKISLNESAYMIQTGKISPWILYLSETGDNLINQYTDDHSKLIGIIIDPGFWMRTFKKNENEVTYIKNLLNELKI